MSEKIKEFKEEDSISADLWSIELVKYKSKMLHPLDEIPIQPKLSILEQPITWIKGKKEAEIGENPSSVHHHWWMRNRSLSPRMRNRWSSFRSAMKKLSQSYSPHKTPERATGLPFNICNDFDNELDRWSYSSYSLPSGTPIQRIEVNTIIVIGSSSSGKSTLIRLLQERCFAYGFSAESLNFIEIDNEKHDLWMSLSASVYLVIFRSDISSSRNNALRLVSTLRQWTYSAQRSTYMVGMSFSQDRRNVSIRNVTGVQKRVSTFRVNTARLQSLENLEMVLYSRLLESTRPSRYPRMSVDYLKSSIIRFIRRKTDDNFVI